MPPIPQTIADALAALVQERAELDGLYAAKSDADTALAAATVTAAAATATLGGAVGLFESHKAALLDLIAATLTSGPPAAAMSAAAAKARVFAPGEPGLGAKLRGITRADFEQGWRDLDLGAMVVHMKGQDVPWDLIISAIVQVLLAWIATRQPKPPAG